jgi:hypothetical protein
MPPFDACADVFITPSYRCRTGAAAARRPITLMPPMMPFAKMLRHCATRHATPLIITPASDIVDFTPPPMPHTVHADAAVI